MAIGRCCHGRRPRAPALPWLRAALTRCGQDARAASPGALDEAELLLRLSLRERPGDATAVEHLSRLLRKHRGSEGRARAKQACAPSGAARRARCTPLHARKALRGGDR